jgi:tetratricopeptide (TPR) repeat protein
MPSSPALLAAALNAHKAGKLPEAAALYQQILAADPEHADALHLMGVLANQIGKPDLAVNLIARAIAVKPGASAFHNNLGNAFKARGDLAEAEKSYRKAVALDPRNADAHQNLGLLMEEQRRFEDARLAYEQALRLAPGSTAAQVGLGNALVALDEAGRGLKYLKKAVQSAPRHAAAHTAYGNALLRLGRREAARTSLERALELDPNSPDALFNLGNLHLKDKELAPAIEHYKRSIAIKPGQADAFNNLGLAYSELQDIGPAKQYFLRALEIDPAYADAHFNLGNALAAEKQHREAIRCFDKVIAIKPDYARAFHNRGASQELLGELEAAEDSYRRAIEADSGYRDVLSNLGLLTAFRGHSEGIRILEEILEHDPDSAEAHWNLGVALLRLGDYARAWPEYEWRWDREKFTSAKRGFPQPHWRGEQLSGKTILLHAEQGFGDTLQFARYVPLVEERGGRVVLEVQPALQRLLARVPGVAECIAKGQPLPEFAWHCPLMSLPLAFGTTLETIPPVALLGPAPGARSEESGLKVGLVWAGNPNHHLDALRSIPLVEYLPLAEVAGVSFASLQMGAAAAQAEAWPGGLAEPLKNAKDFADTAQVVEALDLVITIDSAVAHLAGTLEKPVWILQSPLPDWRWGLESETTPWYPAARLFRRAPSFGWDEVMQRVAAELRRLADARLGSAA